MTPVVVRDQLQDFISRRQEFLGSMVKARDGMRSLGFQKQTVAPGEADLAFLIPRDLFGNQLGGLAKELAVINRIVRIFEEVSVAEPPEIEVREISSSEPTFVLGIPLPTILMIGALVQWGLAKWKTVEEIRKIRRESESLGLPKEIVSKFEDHIQSSIESAVAAKTIELIAMYKGEDARRNELQLGLTWAIESLMARIERGLTVEIRVLPAVPIAEDEVNMGDGLVEELLRINQDLHAMPVLGEPILRLPAAEPPATPQTEPQEA
jgi:hypothetical protein